MATNTTYQSAYLSVPVCVGNDSFFLYQQYVLRLFAGLHFQVVSRSLGIVEELHKIWRGLYRRSKRLKQQQIQKLKVDKHAGHILQTSYGTLDALLDMPFIMGHHKFGCPTVQIISLCRSTGFPPYGIFLILTSETTDRDSLRYTYNGTRRVRQLALGCESN